ncbi:hypothetical protein IFT73_04635 [Aeromicrobium sp. CFBP 8757]|uniref:hypothetical protein n=1 Tax=Aeromicrobium sp. CFBP 8757 TaxID=2775288 RepID=UPI00178632E1|nr:hypothetical protein [Aeromicrobium sp. CFBP 8757]MBD8606130.1 hypothetical protein [Aeromicrobium sp. CFBP 8757]
MTVDDFGVLQAVLDAEAARGNAASVDVAGAAGRGDAPVAQLAGVLDRGAVEVDFELGPLVAWSPRSPREWDLVDTVTGATVRSGSPGPLTWLRRHVAADVVEPRRRLGWLADDPRLGPGLTERRARVHVSGSAVEAFTRIDRLLAALDDVDGVLPEWFVELFAPERDREGWKAYFRERRRLDDAELERAAWTTRWTETAWRRSVSPTERTWRWLDAEVVHEHALDVVVDVIDGAPVDSLKWLLASVGAVRCGPFGSDV